MVGHQRANDPTLRGSGYHEEEDMGAPAPKRSRQASTTVKDEYEPLRASSAATTARPMHSVEADTTYTLQDRINQLNEYIKNLQNDNAKLANEKAEIASKRADLNKRNKDLTNAHVSNLQSIAKRVVEKDEVIQENADLLRENASLRTENAAHVEDLIYKDSRIEELERERDELAKSRAEDADELVHVKRERDDVQRRMETMLATMRKDNSSPERGREEVGSRYPGHWKSDGGRAQGKGNKRSRSIASNRRSSTGYVRDHYDDRDSDDISRYESSESRRPHARREPSYHSRDRSPFRSDARQPPLRPKSYRS